MKDSTAVRENSVCVCVWGPQKTKHRVITRPRNPTPPAQLISAIHTLEKQFKLGGLILVHSLRGIGSSLWQGRQSQAHGDRSVCQRVPLLCYNRKQSGQGYVMTPPPAPQHN